MLPTVCVVIPCLVVACSVGDSTYARIWAVMTNASDIEIQDVGAKAPGKRSERCILNIAKPGLIIHVKTFEVTVFAFSS
ncbi:hypothetical protein F5X96DRAFT_620363 [Biscogniauxia mediterranea]|nr:hypothetical protein F5X96DRAFT_620363 [Biscogniauxia mediterranea]